MLLRPPSCHSSDRQEDGFSAPETIYIRHTPDRCNRHCFTYNHRCAGNYLLHRSPTNEHNNVKHRYQTNAINRRTCLKQIVIEILLDSLTCLPYIALAEERHSTCAHISNGPEVAMSYWRLIRKTYFKAPPQPLWALLPR